jgi:hypothetical protein
MGIVQYPATLSGEVGVLGATKFMVSTDNLATVTAAGYLNNIDLAVYPISRSDIISCLYSFNQQTGAGTLGIFTVAISGTGVITLSSWVSAGDVLLPVVNGNFAMFNGTTGQIKDSSISPSNAAKTKVASINASPVINRFAVYTDTAGTIGYDAANAVNAGNIQAGISGTAGAFVSVPAAATTGSLAFFASSSSGNFNSTVTNASLGQATNYTIPDPGAGTAKFLLDTGNNAMAAGSRLTFAKVTGTEAANAITLNGQAGTITTASLTTAGGTRYNITWTNSFISATSTILLSYMGGTNNTDRVTLIITPGSGTAQLNIFNNGVDPFNGTVIIGFLIV